MRLPVWMLLAVAGLVVIFGAYRIRLAFRSDEDDQRARSRKGLYAMGRRTHFLIGLVYLLLGGALIATSFGWRPFGDGFSVGPSAPPAAKHPAPLAPVPQAENAAPTPGSAAGITTPPGSAATPAR
ncbi:MAG: hypothetical protein AB7P03_07540 [Kofleriaceae bacterium]